MMLTPAESYALDLADIVSQWTDTSSGDTSTNDRVAGATRSILALLDGGSTSGLVVLSPRPLPDLHINGGLAEAGAHLPSEARLLLDRINQIAARHHHPTAEPAQALADFVWSVASMIAEHYLLRPVQLDSRGFAVHVGESFAHELPDALADCLCPIGLPT